MEYPITHSFVEEGEFIQVWNEGTSAWKSIASKFQEFNLPSLRDKATMFPMSDRGNRSLSFGFTGQSHRRDNKTSVQFPRLCDHTDHWAEEMASLTQLLNVCGGAPPESDYSRRRAYEFGNLIHPFNILEGFTPCITDIRSQEVQCHLDSHNDQCDDAFGVVIVASEIKNGERYAGIGYFKNSCGAFYRRLIFTKKAIQRASHILERLDCRRQTVSHAHFPGPHESGGFCRRSACMDKAAHYSPYVHVFRRLVQTHRLDFSRALESLLPVGWDWVTPEQYFSVLSQWVQQDKLPNGNLAFAFLKMNAALGVSVTPSQMKSSLLSLRVAINDVNSSRRIHRHLFYSLVEYLEKSVPGTSKMSCQRLVSVAVLAGLLRHSALAAQACQSPTKVAVLSTRIRESFGCSTVLQASEVIHAVASHLHITRAVSESVFSEMLLGSLDSSRDCYFPGQTFFKVVGAHVLQLFPDGSIAYLEPFVRTEDVAPLWRLPSALKEDVSSPSAEPRSTARTASARPLSITKSVKKRWRLPSALEEDGSSPSAELWRTAGPRSSSSTKRVRKWKRTEAMMELPAVPRVFTRSAANLLPSELEIFDSATPWAEVNLQERAMRIVGLAGRRSFGRENIQYIDEGTSKGVNLWRAICHCNGSTWDPRSNASCSFGGVPHNFIYTMEGQLFHRTKIAALDHLLLYLCLYCDESALSWVRNTLAHHPLVCLRKAHTGKTDQQPFMILFRYKGNICIGHYKDVWTAMSKLCSA
jgi:hypothetical protein